MNPKPSLEKQRQNRAERQKRGAGERETYTPYIQVTRGDFASRGRSHIVPSPFFKRHHHVLSDLELHILWTIQLQTPWDIREQFPLQWNGSGDWFERKAPFARGTVEIAKELGIRHPQFSKEDPKRMTTDFVVQFRNGAWCAFHVKYESDLDKERNIELRTIEDAYWADRGIPLKIVTEQQIDRTVIANVAMAMTYDADSLSPISKCWLKDLACLSADIPMNKVAEILSNRHDRHAGFHINLIKFAIATGLISLDMSVGQLVWSKVWPKLTIRMG
jgi:hypothetical protein